MHCLYIIDPDNKPSYVLHCMPSLGKPRDKLLRNRDLVNGISGREGIHGIKTNESLIIPWASKFHS